tara:strand:+ start:2746 stop:4890 length:2145 start_codon:yes stop_codon:yes gene_type:complete
MINDEKLEIPRPDFLSGLNKAQREAVLLTEGPLLVLSGAGTGKTKVLTSRLANLIYSNKARLSEVLAVTFTNKAAFEMKSRVSKLLGQPTEGMFIGTFHSIGVRILRKNASLINLKNDFTILDTDDQLRLVKQIISYFNLDKKLYNPKNYLYFIEQLKNYALSFDEISNHEFEIYSNGNLSKIYKMYQERLVAFNSVDFGDLIMKPLEMLKKNSDVLHFYQQKLKYILVDEYQDTNTAQYLLLRLLASGHSNICCVGDEDQSIYGWRGAQLKNILNFEKDFKGSSIIRLEQNYRSTGNILSAASNIISENTERIGKKLWTSDADGMRVKIVNVDDDLMEAVRICKSIKDFITKDIDAEQIAILTRATFQFKEIEDRLVKENIRYRVIGGPKFYERKEVRDALAYFRTMINENDDLALERIINTPKRGVGAVLISKLYQNCRQKKISLFHSIIDFLNKDKFSNSTGKKIKEFLFSLECNKKKLDNNKHSEIAGILLDEVGYTDMLKNDKTYESEGRLENLKKLISDISYRDSIFQFLEEVSLVIDNPSNDQNERKVSIMTLHSAKGLEFDYVILPGWEENIFPNMRNLEENGNKGLEEERRLAYVGITRARKSLSIFFANYRRQYNQSVYKTIPSRFLSELPKKNCDLEIKRVENAKKTNQISSIKSEKFQIGEIIFHQEFGKGIILGISESKLQIRFDKNNNIVKVLSDYVKKL